VVDEFALREIEPEVAEIERKAVFQQQAQREFFPGDRGRAADADIERAAVDFKPCPCVMRHHQTAGIELGGGFEKPHHPHPFLVVQQRDDVEHAIHPEADLKTIAERIKMKVRSA